MSEIRDKFKSKKLMAEIRHISRDEAREIVSELKRKDFPKRYIYKVKKYRQWMKEGKWSVFWHPETGGRDGLVRFPQDAIIFWDYGKLFEGAHRMRALAGLDEDLKLPFLVIRGFPKKLKPQYDAWHAREKK